MTSLTLTLTSSTSSLSLKPCLPSILLTTRYNQLKLRRNNGKCCCRAELTVTADAPVAMAIGACILNSLIFPAAPLPEDIEAESLIDSADARFAVMGIISFIPYFNWMSWVFAWMDTGNRRYAVYAIVYLAPYLRSNLSISPEDSWLPIASILLCIAHIQLEASIIKGDIQGIQIFNEAAKHLSSIGRRKNRGDPREDGRKDIHNLPSAGEQFRNEIRDWSAQKLREHEEILDEDEEHDEDSNH